MSDELDKVLEGVIGGMSGLDSDHNPNSQVTMLDDGSYDVSGTYVDDEDVQRTLNDNLSKEVQKHGGRNLAFGAQVELPGLREEFSAPEEKLVPNFFVPMEVTGGSITGGGTLEKFVSGGVSKTAGAIAEKFSGYKNDLESNVNNLVLLKKFLDSGFTRLYGMLNECKDGSNVEVDAVKSVHDQVLKEVDFQIGNLQKLLDVHIKPTKKDLDHALSNFTTFDKVAELLLPYEFGTTEASDRLAVAYTGIFQLKNTAMKVKKALENSKMSLKEYEGAKNMGELKNKLMKALKNNNMNDINNLIEGMNILKNNFQNRSEIANFIKNPKKMENLVISGGSHETFEGTKMGRIMTDNLDIGLSKKIRQTNKTITEIFKLFIHDVNSKFNDIKKSVEYISLNIGDDIDYNDNLVEFINAYENLGELTNESLYYTLIELKKDSSAKQEKQMFLDNLKTVSDTLNALKGGKYGTYFKNIQSNINLLIETVDTYTDTLKRSDTVLELKSGGNPSDLFIEGNLASDSLVASSTSLISETANKLKFYGNLVAMKNNLHSASNQFKVYKEKYDDLLGKTIGNKLSLLEDDYKSILNSIESTESESDIGSKLKGSSDVDKETLKSLIKLQYEAKEGLYQVIEAVDSYLMNFTEQIQASPEDVSNVEKMLSSVQVISKWFTDQTGNDLSGLFELMSESEGETSKKLIEGDKVSEEEMKEYALEVHGVMKELPLSEMKTALEKTKKALEGVTVLKNIIATFVYVGDKFNKKTLQSTMLMSANVMYKKLFKYLWVSAFEMNLYDEKSPKADLFKFSLVSSNPKHDIFATDDAYLVLVLKSMIAKVFTVIGTYSLLNDSTHTKNLVNNQTRMILGGNSEPVIINEALELYVRLPLLVEFYKDIFDSKQHVDENNMAKSGSSEVITYIPEVGSVWSNLLTVIFEKSKYIDNNIYTTHNLNNIIQEINAIYKHYAKSSSGDNLIRDVVNGLVAEINRNYGILKRSDIEKYYQMKEKYENPDILKTEDLTNNLNFDILDADNEYQLPAPSKKYTKSHMNGEMLKYKRQMTDDMDMVHEFRNAILEKLNVRDVHNINSLSFKQYIKLYKEELRATTSNEKKYDIVVNAINSSNDSNLSNKHYYILFNELVTTSLCNLENLHNLIKTFINQFINNYDSNSAKAFELLFNFASTNDMIVLKYQSTTQLVMMYNKLEDVVSKTIDNVKYLLQKFNIVIDKKMIADARVQLYELEDDLLKKLIKNTSNKSKNDPSLELVVTKLSNIKNVDLSTFKNELFAANTVSQVEGVEVKTSGELNTLEKDMYKIYDHSKRTWNMVEDINPLASSSNKLVSSVNNLLRDYLHNFYDVSNKKIYGHLLSHLNNNMVSMLGNFKLGNGNSNDFAGVQLNNDDNLTFDKNSVLSANVTYLVKTLLNRTINPQLDNKVHLLTELSEVSPHMVEKFRSDLPIFMKQFKSFINKCMFVKHVYLRNESNDNSLVVDALVDVCNNVLSDIDSVMTEVNQLDNNVTPMFMEMKHNFIRNYFNTTGEVPFMPLAALTKTLKNYLPMKIENSMYESKFRYGVKDILHNKKSYKMSNMMYVNELFKNYNSSVNNVHVLDSNKVDTNLELNVEMLRFNNDIKFNNEYSNDDHKVLSNVMFNANTYFVNQDVSNIINMVENTMREVSVSMLFTNLYNAGNSTLSTISRDQSKILNIMDLNIVPVNVHALLREIPLINIYNYAYTFDGILDNEINSNNRVVRSFKSLMVDPLQNMPSEYSSIMNEPIDELNLNKPRFLSDQLHSKVLTGDVRKERADTKFIKQLVFLTNLQRYARVFIKSRLENINTKIVNKIKMTSEQITDYIGTNNKYNEDEFSSNL